MKGIFKRLTNAIGKGKLLKLFFNLSPMYRSTGGRIMEMSDDFHYVKLKLPLTRRTRNYVGTLYGGHMYSCVDGIYMVQLINILGKNFVVWDKSASIRFRRPGNQTLYAEFPISKEFIQQIKTEIAELGEKDYILPVNLVDSEGKIYAEVEKVIYISSKEFYSKKQEKRTSRTSN